MPDTTIRPWLCPQVDEQTGWRCPSSTDEHDNYTAYRYGCRSGAARVDRSRYVAGRKEGVSRLTSPTGIARRIAACHYMGWTGADVAVELGTGRRRVNELLRNEQAYVRASTLPRMAPPLERLATTPTPDKKIHKKTRTWARNRGFLSLLAWDDIDDPNAEPYVDSDAGLEVASTDFDSRAFDAVRDGRLRITDVTTREQDDIVERMWRDQLTRVERPGAAIAELLGVEYALIDRIRARTIKRQAHQNKEAS